MSNQFLLAPVVNGQHFVDGALADGHKIRAYAPGTTTPASLFNGSGETLTQPVLIGPLGFPDYALFMVRGTSLDFVLLNPGNSVVRSWSSISVGGGRSAGVMPEWSPAMPVIGAMLSSDGKTLTVVSTIDIRELAQPGRRTRVLTTSVFRYGNVAYFKRNLSDYFVVVRLDSAMTPAEFLSVSAMHVGFANPLASAIPGRVYRGGETELVGETILGSGSRLNIWPIGAVVRMPSVVGSFTPGYTICDGQAISRTSKSLLFAATGTVFGTGNGSTTFNVPTIASSGGLNSYIYDGQY